MSETKEAAEESMKAPEPKQTTKRPADVSSPSERTPGSKRKRKPAELYQSDVIDACSKQTRSSSDAKREVFLPKGGYVAVRSEDGFYLCQVLHYVYDDTVGPIQVQWMEKKSNNVYELDYMDSVDRESVLTEVRLNPGGERGLKTLPAAEKERIDKILGFSLQKEQGLLQGVDSSNLAEAVTASIIMSKNQAKHNNPRKPPSASHKNGSFLNGQPSTSVAEMKETNEKRQPTRKPRGSRRIKEADDERKAVVKLKHIKPFLKLHKIEEKKNAKRRSKGARNSVNSGSQHWKGTNQNPNKALKPNSSIALVSTDRFQAVQKEDDVSENSNLMLCKEAIHAVLTDNQGSLQRLIDDRLNVPSVFVSRSADVQENALLYSMQLKSNKAFDVLSKELFSSAARVGMSNPVLDKSQPKRFHHVLMGHRTKIVNAAKGTKEGNFAFARDLNLFNASGEPYLNIVQFAMKNDVPLDFLEKLAVNDPEVLTKMQQNAYIAVRSGNRLLAGEVIKTCQGKETVHGFHKLHEQVLLVDNPEELPNTSIAITKKKSADNAKMTPFHCAAINPNAKVLAHLLTYYAGDTLSDQHGWTLLHYAAACKGPAPLALLLSRGVPADTGTCRGLTPLMIASKLGQLQNVVQLLKPSKGQGGSGSSVRNVDKKDNNGFTALHYAAENGYEDICRLLAKHTVDFECASSPNTDKVTPLILAARKGHYQTVQALVDLGCYIEGKDKFKRTPLIHAVMNGHEPVVAFLLRKGAGANTLDSSRNSPLHYAAGYGWFHCVKLLLQGGADPKLLNDSKVPPHWIAFLKGHLGCVDLLLKEPGTDVNMRDADGWTMVTMAVKFDLTPSRLKSLLFLVEEKKADATTRDFIGWNALHHLASNTAEHLDGHDAGVHEEVALKMANVLVKNGCSPSSPTTNHETALGIAVKQKHLNSSLIHCFIENGAQLSLDANENGENILHAMSRGIKDTSQIEMFDFLCEMLGKPELHKESPTNNKLLTPVKEFIQPPDIKDPSNASSAQMPILEQEANHLRDKLPGADKIPMVVTEEKSKIVISNDTKNELTNNSTPVTSSGGGKENSLPKISSSPKQDQVGGNVKSQTPTKDEKVTPMEVDKHPPRKVTGSGTVGPVPQLIHLAADRDMEGFTPLHRLCQEYTNVCHGATRKNLKEDVITLLKGFVERAKCDINAMTEVSTSAKDLKGGGESKTCLHILVHCEEKTKGTKEATLSSVLEAFLSYKPNVNAPSVPLRRTPLIEAIKEKKHHIVDILLEAGADVNFMSPLILAAQLSELSLVTKLVKKGANVKCQDLTSKDGPLHFIASSSCDPREICATLKVLLDSGADMNGKNVQQRTPLHLAVNAHSGKADSSSQVVEFLLDHGADPFAQDSTGSIPLHIAFSKYPNVHSDNKAAVDPIEVVCALTAAMKNRKIDTPDNNGNTPLHRAAQHGATISCMHLIKRVPNINAKNILNNTPLNLAVSMKQEGTTIALLQNDNVDVTNPLKVRARKYAEWEHKIEKFNKYWHWELMKPWPPLKTFNFSLISQVVQRQWHGVLFLLMDHLERAGLSKTAVVEAAIDESRFQLALSLLSKIKANKDVEAVNAQGQNLLHILMYIMPTKTTPLHLEVGNELLRRGVGLGLDKHQCSPLTYAALDQSAEFCKMLIDHRREECLQLLRSTDVKGRSPLAAVFWRLDNDMQQLEGTLKFLLECGVTLDQNMPLPRRDLILQEPEMDPDDFYLFWDGPIGQFSPLIGAILARDKSMVKLLLDLGADPNFADPDKVTPLMHAVKMNDLGIIKLLFGLHEKDEPIPAKRKETKVSPKPEMKTTSGGNSADMSEEGATEKMDVDADLYDDFPQKIAVTAVDKYGRCAVHYMVNTCKYGTYENEEILAFFAKCRVPLDSKDSSGKTVLDFAKELHLEKLLKGLHKVLNISGEVPLPLVPVRQEVEPPTHRFDIKADAGKMLERLKAQEVGDSALSSASGREAEVDPDSGCTEGSEVLKDKEQNIPYSVYLTVVDVKQGTYGMNLYYKMQIILQREKGKEVFLLFTKSGRVGCVGQHQCTPYTSDASATEEFKKIFKIKTGNVWSQYKEFKPIRSKFKLLVFQVPRSKRSKLSFDISLCPPSKLSQSLKALMTEATQLEPLEDVQRCCEIDMKAMPFGRLDEDVLSKAKGKLEAIRGLLTDFKREETNGLEELRKKNAKMQDIMEKVSDLTMDYYQLIPYSEFNPSEMLPLHTMVNLQQAERVIETLLALELTGKILLGATYHCKDVNILDYTFGALECKMDSLERNSEEAQLILQQIASSGRDVYRSVNVEAIYKLTRRGEQERLNSLNLGNHKLLWHGMKAGHLLSTLKRGLVRSPSEVTSTGIMLGEGIRLSDTFSRGLQYCDAYQKTSKVKFMLLCEVSLGKEHIPEKPGDGLTEGLHHIKGEGSLYPDPRFDLRLPSGVVISMGKLIQGKSSLEFNEYVVQKDSQVRLRYLLQFNQEEH